MLISPLLKIRYEKELYAEFFYRYLQTGAFRWCLILEIVIGRLCWLRQIIIQEQSNKESSDVSFAHLLYLFRDGRFPSLEAHEVKVYDGKSNVAIRP